MYYRWHPLHGRSARRIQSERRASGECVHVELTPGVVTILPAWKVDPVYCAGLKVGAPQISLAALCGLKSFGRLRRGASPRTEHRHAGGKQWDRSYGSYRGRQSSREPAQGDGGTAPTRLGLEKQTEGLTPAERQAYLVSGDSHAGSARPRKAGGGDENE